MIIQFTVRRKDMAYWRRSNAIAYDRITHHKNNPFWFPIYLLQNKKVLFGWHSILDLLVSGYGNTIQGSKRLCVDSENNFIRLWILCCYLPKISCKYKSILLSRRSFSWYISKCPFNVWTIRCLKNNFKPKENENESYEYSVQW